jgi:hypothetical protein
MLNISPVFYKRNFPLSPAVYKFSAVSDGYQVCYKMRGRKNAASQKPTKGSALRWRPSTGHLMFLVLGVLLAVGLHQFMGGMSKQQSPVLTGRNAATLPSTNRWGDLEIVPIVLERPEEYFQGDPPVLPKTVWFFKQQTPKQLQEFLLTCGFPVDQLAMVMDTNRWVASERGIWLEPPLDLVRDMAPDARERLYRTLAEYPENVTQRYPYVYRKDGFDEWFSSCNLPPETIRLLRKMTYVRNDRLLFSDGQYFQLTLPSNQVKGMARTLARVPTLLMKLKVTPQSDIDMLLNYWGSSTRNRSLKPFFQSMARVPEGATMSASYFFPPVPRLLVYSYPNPANLGAPKPPDCFWTAMNFWSETQEHRFLDSEYTKKVLASDYQRVPKANAFGDVMMLFKPGPARDWEAVHMCVYIADNVVYTKNGADLYQPWVLMRMEDLLVNYPGDKTLQVSVFRRKD